MFCLYTGCKCPSKHGSALCSMVNKHLKDHYMLLFHQVISVEYLKIQFETICQILFCHCFQPCSTQDPADAF